jgi:cell shape-determining protein MreD
VKKSIIKIALISLFTIFAFVLQLMLFNNINILGVKVNIILVCATIVCLALKSNFSIPYAFLVGLITDISFKFTIGPATVSFLILSIAITFIKDMYNKYHTGFLFVLIIFNTFIFEGISYADTIIRSKSYVSIWLLLWVVLKCGLIHFAIAYFIKRISDKLEFKYRQDSAWKKGMSQYKL